MWTLPGSCGFYPIADFDSSELGALVFGRAAWLTTLNRSE